jgi:hypothetical protein
MATTPSLKTLLVASKSTEVELPGFPGFTIEVSFLSREVLTQIRKKSTKTVYKNRQPVEELDEKLFIKLYVDAAIKGWKGLKYSYLEQLAPVDISGQNAEDEFPYSAEEAVNLMQASSIFDGFVTETVSELSNFNASNTKN